MSKPENVARLLAQCEEDRGVVEVPLGSNRGPRVNQMLAYTGLGGGYFWCCAAVTAWLVEAFGKLNPVPRTADCDVVLNWAKKKKVLHKSGPQPGDLFLCMRSDTDAYHIGVVVEVIDDDYILAWEGNTNPGGSNNGYGVFRRRRSRHNLYYVRWVDAMESAQGAPAPAKEEPQWSVWVSPHGLFPRVITHEGRPYAPVRALVAAILGISAEATQDLIGWNVEAKSTTVNGEPIPKLLLKDSVSWGPVREVAGALGCVVGAKDDPGTEGFDVTIGPPAKKA